MYEMGEDNKLCKCLTTLETHIVLKELHGVVEDILLQILL
jgi:hypothetical protein